MLRDTRRYTQETAGSVGKQLPRNLLMCVEVVIDSFGASVVSESSPFMQFGFPHSSCSVILSRSLSLTIDEIELTEQSIHST